MHDKNLRSSMAQHGYHARTFSYTVIFSPKYGFKDEVKIRLQSSSNWIPTQLTFWLLTELTCRSGLTLYGFPRLSHDVILCTLGLGLRVRATPKQGQQLTVNNFHFFNRFLSTQTWPEVDFRSGMTFQIAALPRSLVGHHCHLRTLM